MRLKIVDKFIIKLWLSYFLALSCGLLGLIFVFGLVDALFYESSFISAIEYSLKKIPPAIETLGPFLGLMSTLLTFSKLYKESEIISLKSAGLTNFRIILSILFLSFFIVFFLYINQSFLFTAFNSQNKNLLSIKHNKKANWYYSDNTLIKVVEPSLFSQRIKQVELIDFDFSNQSSSHLILNGVNKNNDLWIANSARWVVQKNQTLKQQYFTNYSIMEINLDDVLQIPSRTDIYQGFYSLYQDWKSSKLSQNINRTSILLILKKISYLASFFIFVFLAIIFSESETRSNKNLKKFLTAIFIYYFYWFGDQILFIMSKSGTLNIIWGSFGANIVLTIYIIWNLSTRKI